MASKLPQIIAQIFSILGNDYAGTAECDATTLETWHRLCTRAAKSKILDDRLMLRYMNQLIATLGDHNLAFLPGPTCAGELESCGYRVRRDGDVLRVTALEGETRLVPGDAIVGIDGASPLEHLSYALGNPTGSDDPDRQDWHLMLGLSSHVTVRHEDGTQNKMKTRHFPLATPDSRPCSLVFHDDGTCILTITQLDTPEAADLLQQHHALVAKAPRLIMDLRTCTGGSEEAMYPLLDWLFDEPVPLQDILGAETLLTNYTEANCEARETQISQLRQLTESGNLPAGTMAWLDEALASLQVNRGKGWIAETVEPETRQIESAPAGQRVILLTDCTTSDAAERLVLAARASTRTTVAGRPTLGNLDYSNPVAVTFDGRFVFVYPMTKTIAARDGHGMKGHGIAPDITVPFTAAECTHDCILELALGL